MMGFLPFSWMDGWVAEASRAFIDEGGDAGEGSCAWIQGCRSRSCRRNWAISVAAPEAESFGVDSASLRCRKHSRSDGRY